MLPLNVRHLVAGITQEDFWKSRLAFILANGPFILYMQLFHPSWLVPYLVWMSWATWLSSELPTGGGR